MIFDPHIRSLILVLQKKCLSDTSASSYVPPDQSSDGWLTDCFGDANTQFSLKDMYVHVNHIYVSVCVFS